MIDNFDDVIYYEMLAEQQEIEDDSESNYKELLIAIALMIQSGEPFKKIKKLIKKANVNKDLSKNLRKISNEQIENILDEKNKIDFEEAVIAGYTFNELIKIRKKTTEKQAIKFAVKAQDLFKENNKIDKDFIRSEIDKYKKGLTTFYRTQTKRARETGYAVVDRIRNKNIKGWLSVAILDNRTSAICLSLNNKFYSAKDYKTRFDIPNQIPRHPNCRSSYVTVYKNDDIEELKTVTVDSFLRDNPEAGKEILGQKKYRIFESGKAKFDKFVDIKTDRYFTNKDIIKKLGIKNEARLKKINNKAGG